MGDEAIVEIAEKELAIQLRLEPEETPVHLFVSFAPFIEQRAPEVGWNGVVLHRELQELGFTGGYLQVQRKRNALAGRRFASWDALNAWLEQWCLTIADQRVHGTTHQRPVERFAEEALTPLGLRAPYQYEQRRHRRVPADALVAIAAGRYSVPVQYVGTTVTIAETTTHYEISAGTTLIARHLKRPRFSVTMEPAHYAGLLRPTGVAPRPPQADPAYRPFGEVAVRDLAI